MPDIAPEYEGGLFLTEGMPPIKFVTRDSPESIYSQIKHGRKDGIFEMGAITDTGIKVQFCFRDEFIAGVTLREKSKLATK